MNIYKEAAQQKLRFPTNKGFVNVEDLFDMSLNQLDASAKVINKALKTSVEESFISEASEESATTKLALDIVKDVIADKLSDKAEREGLAAKKIKKDKLLAALARKQDEGIDALSEDELKKQIEAL